MQEFQNNSNLTKYLDNIWEKIEYKGITSPEPRSGHCSVIFQDRFLFIFGGYNDKEALNDMYKCDMNNLVWEKVEYLNKENEIPSKRASCTIICYEDLNCLYLFGGTGYIANQLSKNNLYEFSINKSKWRILKTSGNPPSERYGHSMNIYKTYIVIFGGVRLSNRNNNNIPEYLNDLNLYSILDKRWVVLQVNGTIPQPRHGHQSLVIRNDLYIVGGSNTSVRFGNLHKFEFETNKWIYMNFESTKKKEKDILFKGRYCHGAVIDDDEIFIYGGRDDEVCNDVLHLDLKEKTWNRKKMNGVKPESREFFSLAYYNRKMVIFGGRKAEKKLNDLHIWHISVPRASFKDCTLREEILEMSKSFENFSDVRIYSPNKKEYRAHSCVLKQRCNYLFKKILKKENEQIIFLEFDELYIEIIIKYIYSGEIDLFLLNQNQLVELVKILSLTDLEIFLKASLLKIMNDIDLEKDLESFLNMISNIRSTNLKEKDFLIQNNLNLMEKLQEWIEFRQKLLKNSYTKEENKEILNKIRKYNTPFEDIKLQTIKRFYEDFDNLFNDVNSSDFEIQCKSRNYKVHKCVLAARSYYFESVFSQETLENQKNILKLDPMIINSEEIFETTLRYFYQGFYGMKKFVFNFEYFNSLLQICNYFDIKCPSFNFILEDKISEYLEEKNCIEILDMADKIGASIVKLKTLGFIASRFQKIIVHNEEVLKNLPNNLLVELMVFYSNQHS